MSAWANSDVVKRISELWCKGDPDKLKLLDELNAKFVETKTQREVVACFVEMKELIGEQDYNDLCRAIAQAEKEFLDEYDKMFTKEEQQAASDALDKMIADYKAEQAEAEGRFIGSDESDDNTLH